MFKDPTLKTQTVEDYYYKGVEKLRLEDYSASIRAFNRVIKKSSADVAKWQVTMAYHNRGIAKEALKDYKGALEDLNTSIKHDPDFAESYLNRGLIKSKLEDSKGASRILIKRYISTRNTKRLTLIAALNSFILSVTRTLFRTSPMQ